MRTPYDQIGDVPTFTLESNDVENGRELDPPQRSGIFGAGGSDTSPELHWSGFPAGTRSFAVTMYDPLAPTASGFWHWAVADIPVSTTSLPTGAGEEDSTLLPPGAWQLTNDASLRRYLGAAPPAGHGRHNYYIAVHALDVDTIGIPETSTPAFLTFNLGAHTLARAVITPWWEAR
ncbi:YbhB/YbcL family Raf kinase inhibitor-like protein [Cryobacterium sp. MDB1-18-2]|uniref:YbhB/YbcL family Raf kinase inhibitor-like protein n=2 Tax=Microbacteriaceae TaxID=85023 RepID=A0ABY2IPM2_9MICO|nr:YbhB/YbcL family Raf kinase inhibitor-like protein [Cryobacterium sp. MDB2-A-1]TFC02342.1 YbhB/YbcL family Raf kinase inhibitor-like protein [Cryobacterium sp. MDB2-33-2]TFC10036.1 YbhB/YbcL family Raf kinase inhibitor-like protein [Cryobacterium sp. MDB2-A-2]TFC20714.1 YbhB/YbcL family Raf kinase inhibitor-like protein [Cryobacterium glucosi]TFC22341.1 YbhB/YbcL family Raf kinase inhibitor-like protein [Cryobacterium sp. MDB2-10]TFC24144.1 YbhB/YbcL family Raf kinase inhibitor-like protein